MKARSAEAPASPIEAGVDVSYRDALAWLFGTQLFGIKLGLDNIHRLLRALDLPAHEQRIIHVAGTNGKGSVCAMLDAICRATGYRTGLFTSPHLVTFRERIQVDGAMISEPAVAEGLTTIRELVTDWEPHPTFFEITTALALQHFRASACDIVVLETGMGGRLDATNAAKPIVSVLTPIDFDHQKWLGNTLPEIAAEKAGIIKSGVPVVSAFQPPKAAAVVSAHASAAGAPLEFVPADVALSTNLAGAHQQRNAALAVAALRAGGIKVDARTITAGLQNVTWPGRFQHWNDRITVDGAHNAAGARVLAQTWRHHFGDKQALVLLAVLSDKNVVAIIEALAPITSRFVFPQVRSERAVPPDELAAHVRATAPDLLATTADSLSAALQDAQATREHILITGSLHFVGEALATLSGDLAQLDDCLQ